MLTENIDYLIPRRRADTTFHPSAHQPTRQPPRRVARPPLSRYSPAPRSQLRPLNPCLRH